jgi:ATP adenylyltransferase/5',5'''-P-1,P-4-tetraphosphate phosphorylase II
MIETGKTIKDIPIQKFVENNDFSEAAKRLISLQKETWQLLSSGYNSLKLLKIKTKQFEGFDFVIQFNAGRYISTSAIVDDKEIANRKCFLCEKNLPLEQEGIIIKDYVLLANPYPIFPEHFTIANRTHKKQNIKNNFEDLLFFSKILSKYYTIFYNGPRCGASAPDHMHFQAGSKNVMPFDSDIDRLHNRYGEIISSRNDYKVFFTDDGLRKFISIESKEENILNDLFRSFYQEYSLGSDLDEPMMNILSSYNEEKGWRVSAMLRAKHRPEEYYLEGEQRIVFSPAACDYGGLCITPLEKDFKRFDKGLLNKIFIETSISEIKFNQLKEALKLKI